MPIRNIDNSPWRCIEYFQGLTMPTIQGANQAAAAGKLGYKTIMLGQVLFACWLANAYVFFLDYVVAEHVRQISHQF